MPYGYTDEQWARIDSPTKYRIIQEAQKQAKPKTTTTTTTPKTTTTTPKTTTTTTSTSATQPTQGSAAKAAATYNPTTGTGTFDDGTQYTKYTWEPDPNDPSKLYRENAGTGARLADDYIPNPQYTPTQTQPQDPYAEMLAEMRRQQEETLAEIRQQQEALAQAQREAQIARLQKARDAALSSLEAERASIDPYYYDKRNQAAAQSDIGAKNFAEYMAAQGIRGSAAGLPEIYRNAALQGQIGRLNQQQAAEHADIARRRSGIEQAYQSDLAAANAGIDAQTLQAYIDSMKTLQQQRAADLAAMGLTSTGQLTLAGREAQNAELERRAALLAAQHYDDIQAYINTLDPNDPLVPYLYAERQKKIQTEAERAAAAAAAASEAEKEAWNRAFKAFQEVGRITSPEQAQILGLPMDATVADVDIARMNAQTSRLNAQTSAYNAQQRTQQQAAQASSQRIKQYADIIDRLYVNTQYDNDGRAIGKTFDPATVKAYIQNLNQTGQISDDEARQLLVMYNFTF